MAVILSNFATSTLSAAIDATDTQLSIQATDAALFPNLNGDDWCPLVLVDDNYNHEIVYATARQGAIFDIKRGQEGTKPITFAVGSRVDVRLTAATVNDLDRNLIADSRLPNRLHPTAIDMIQGNINDIDANGSYFVPDNSANAPAGIGFIDHREGPQGQALQQWTAIDGPQRFIRTRLNGVWSPWTELTIAADKLNVWAMQPIGIPIPLFDNLKGVDSPPKDLHFRYVKLTAGSDYNKDILRDEKVAGSGHDITATAQINLTASPLHGQTIRLINSERRFLRAGSSGTVQDSQNLSHNHSGSTSTNGHHSHSYTRQDITFIGNGPTGLGGWHWFAGVDAQTSATGNHNHTFTTSTNGGDEARPRNIGITYFMRIL